jgi:hypothetical protein
MGVREDYLLVPVPRRDCSGHPHANQSTEETMNGEALFSDGFFSASDQALRRRG